MSMKNTARHSALIALERCRRDGAWSGDTIDSVIRNNCLEKREASLSSRLVLGVLQNCTLCDFYIDKFCNSKLEPKIRDILRLGVYQILFLDRIPARAAVNESVSLCRDAGYERAAGLVNAVLRRIAENRDKLPEIPDQGSSKYLSIKYSHPEWLVDRLINERGYVFAEKILEENNSLPKLYVQVNSLKINTKDYLRLLDKEEIEYGYSGDVSGCIELKGGAVTELPGFAEGYVYVQDKAARAAADIAGACSGMSVLDACAAPGGKSFSAAIAMNNCGRILSCDIHGKKLSRINEGAERLGITIIETLCRDARSRDEEFDASFDVVIADVPCSGIGVIGKKPEIRFKPETEIAALPEIQYAILESLSGFVKPGGTLLYSTCTVLKAENEEIAERFLKEHSNFIFEDFSLGNILSQKGMYTFWPHIDGTDGFFAAKLKRIY